MIHDTINETIAQLQKLQAELTALGDLLGLDAPIAVATTAYKGQTLNLIDASGRLKDPRGGGKTLNSQRGGRGVAAPPGEKWKKKAPALGRSKVGKPKIKPAVDPKRWPAVGGTTKRTALALTVQKILRQSLDQQPGITRKELHKDVQRRLPAVLKGRKDNKGHPKWRGCLSNMIHNYIVAGYIREKVGPREGRSGNANHKYWVGG